MEKRKYESKILIAEYRYLSEHEKFRFSETAYRLKDGSIIIEYNGAPLSLYGLKLSYNKNSGATKLGQSSKELRNNPECVLNSPLNRTYISTNANSIISDKKAEDYFKDVSNLAKYGHCIPSPIEEKYKKQDNESNEEYYERVVKQRYDEILRDLQQELENLKLS